MDPDEDGGFDLWKIGRCRYDCVHCSRTFSNSAVFWHHVQHDHSISPAKYRSYVQDYCSEAVHIKCEICDCPMLHDFGKMTLHLRKAHDGEISLEDYYEMFVKSVGEPEKKSPDTSPVINSKHSNVKNLDSHFQDQEPKESESSPVKLPENYSKAETSAPQRPAPKDDKSPESHYLRVESDEADDSWVLGVSYLADPSSSAFQAMRGEPCRICRADLTSMTSVQLNHHAKTHRLNLVQYYKMFFDQSRWMDCCLYKCLECNDFTSLSRLTFDHHIRKDHKMTSTQFAQKHGKCVFRKSLFRCVLCDKVMMHDVPSMCGHFGNCHGMTRDQYYQKIVDSFNCGRPITPLKDSHPKKAVSLTLVKEGLTPNGMTTRHNRVVTYKVKTEETTTKEKSNQSWINKCEYKCGICSFTCHAIHTIQAHVRLIHKISMKQYRRKHGDTRTVLEHHSCKLCGDQVIADYARLYMHLRTSHYIPMCKYRKLKQAFDKVSKPKMVLKSQVSTNDESSSSKAKDAKQSRKPPKPEGHCSCIFECSCCTMTFKAMNQLVAHLKDLHPNRKMSLLSNAKHVIRRVNQKCHICKNRLLSYDNVIKNHRHHQSKSQQETDHLVRKSPRKPTQSETEISARTNENASVEKWYNGFVFQCDKCEKTFYVACSMRLHLNEFHSESHNFHSETYLVKKTYLKCELCDNEMPRVVNEIQSHLSSHGFTIQQYEDRFRPALASQERGKNTKDDVRTEPSLSAALESTLQELNSILDENAPSSSAATRASRTKPPLKEVFVLATPKTFWCRLCAKNLILNEFLQHLRDEHDLSLKHYRGLYHKDRDKAVSVEDA